MDDAVHLLHIVMSMHTLLGKVRIVQVLGEIWMFRFDGSIVLQSAGIDEQTEAETPEECGQSQRTLRAKTVSPCPFTTIYYNG